MPRSHRLRLLLIGVALAVMLGVAAVAVAGDPRDDGPRNPAAEAATGDTRAMLAVVQDTVDCLRAMGFQPGDARVEAQNVIIADWNPAPGSAAWRADEECAFPVH